MNSLSGCAILIAAWFGPMVGTLDNPAAGTWKLNPQKSNITEAVPPFVHHGILKIDGQIFTGTTGRIRSGRTPKVTTHSDPSAVFKFELSPDAQNLILTNPGSGTRFRMIFERQ
jgi:hypothetical protein